MSSTLAVLATATCIATCLDFAGCRRTDLTGSADKLSADACAQATAPARHALVRHTTVTERRLIAAALKLAPASSPF
jgi:hypothetical protein